MQEPSWVLLLEVLSPSRRSKAARVSRSHAQINSEGQPATAAAWKEGGALCVCVCVCDVGAGVWIQGHR